MARNRKRAKERRARRPQPTIASARGERGADSLAAPDPIAHATPDSELADAQMALGRPELSEDGPDAPAAFDEEESESPIPGVVPERLHVEDGELSPEEHSSLPAAPAPGGNRLVNFIQGSWRELQRVQWPDRRQVMQATGVVIGFVVVAGLYLGAADWVAGKIVNLIIK